MPENEFETVTYRKIKHLNVLFNNITFRNFHIHNEIELLCVFRGNCNVNVRGQQISAESGSVILINHNEAHEIQSAESVDCIVIQISNHMLMEYFPKIRTTFFGKAELTDDLGAEDRRLLWQYIYGLAREYTETPPYYELRCISLFAELLRFIYGHCPHTVYSEQKYIGQKKATGRVNRIVNYIQDNYDSKLSLSDLAEREELTPTYLSHFFKEQFGITFQEYVSNIRFEHALRMIGSRQMSLYEIAVQCGFSDVKYMAKLFRERFGCTPRAYTQSQSEQALRKTGGLAEARYGTSESLELLEACVKPLTFGHVCAGGKFDAQRAEQQ